MLPPLVRPNAVLGWVRDWVTLMVKIENRHNRPDLERCHPSPRLPDKRDLQSKAINIFKKPCLCSGLLFSIAKFAVEMPRRKDAGLLTLSIMSVRRRRRGCGRCSCCCLGVLTSTLAMTSVAQRSATRQRCTVTMSFSCSSATTSTQTFQTIMVGLPNWLQKLIYMCV